MSAPLAPAPMAMANGSDVVEADDQTLQTVLERKGDASASAESTILTGKKLAIVFIAM